NLAFNGGYTIEIILFYPKIYPLEKAQELSGKSEIIEINKEVFNKLAYRESTGGLIAVARTKDLGISKLKLSDNSLILIAEATEKPGNIGALLRTADAANLDAVVIANPKCDIYNPNVIRSSVGCIFTNQIIVCDSKDVIHFLKENNIRLFCASLQNSTSYNNQNYKESTAIVVGNETHGLSDFWLDLGTNIKIPMRGKIDSMNVSVSAAVLIFEAIRQREFS
ncbi:TrmH family RNA methyltransferase, partial [Flavobacteriales bacterium]|nr:TrmH family RNA methyltransferase [Flavobacteriales bacterium]